MRYVALVGKLAFVRGSLAAADLPGGGSLSDNNTFVVDTSDDGEDTSPGDEKCSGKTTKGDTRCTLRGAIMEANAKSGRQTIQFSVDKEPRMFVNDLPPLTDAVVIDGFSQSGLGQIQFDAAKASLGSTAGPGMITLVGQHKGGTALRLMASDSEIRGLGFYYFGTAIEVVGHNFTAGVYIEGQHSRGAVIQGVSPGSTHRGSSRCPAGEMGCISGPRESIGSAGQRRARATGLPTPGGMGSEWRAVPWQPF